MLLSNGETRSAHRNSYRFAGVVLDPQRARLLVDRQEIAVSSLSLKLLLSVCEARGAVVTRQALFDLIWPRQTVSDESLTKLISRTRELLGPYGAAIVTVRGQGVRLDAKVTIVVGDVGDGQPTIEESKSPEDVAAIVKQEAEPAPRARLRKLGIAALLFAIVAAGNALWGRFAASQASNLIMRSYAIESADVQSSRPETASVLHLAESAVDTGDLMRERQLLVGLHAQDPSSPIAGMLLATIDATGGDQTSAARWAKEASARIGPDSTLYTRLFGAYVQSLTDLDSDGGRAALDAVIALRPSAWRLQLRRAHMDLARRDGPAALAALRSIPMSGTPPQTLVMVLDDRIALGDENVVASALNEGLLADFPSQRMVLEAHIDWRRGNSASAITRLDDAATIAEANHAFSVAARAREAAALHAYASNNPGAATRLVASTKMLSDEHMLLYICDLKALAAELDFEAGDVAVARRLLDEAKTSVQFPEQLVELEILNTRIKAFPAFYFAKSENTSRENWRKGEDHLLRAWWAYGTQNEKLANDELSQAEGAGVLTTFFAEDALLLSSLLTSKDAPCDVDPLYPNYFRLSACRALEKISRERRQLGQRPSI